MATSTKTKGNVILKRIKDILEAEGWLVDKVEKTGKFVKHKDLFASYDDEFGFDQIAIRNGTIILIQAKANCARGNEIFKAFAKEHAHARLRVEQWVWKKRCVKINAGFVIHKYLDDGQMVVEDRRKRKKKYQ